MSFGATAPAHLQPESFAFTPDNLERARAIIGNYPHGRQQSAILPLLDLAQRQHDNWLPRAAMDYVADLLDMPRIRAYEVATFFTMFNKAPVGRYLLQVCTTTPCWLCNSDAVLKAIRDETGAGPGHDSADGLFSVVEVECLGACVNAPMMQINDDYYEDLDYDRTCRLIEGLRRGESVTMGSQTGRTGSQAASGPTSLLAAKRPRGADSQSADSRPQAPDGAEIDNSRPAGPTPEQQQRQPGLDPNTMAEFAKGPTPGTRSDATPDKAARPATKIAPERADQSAGQDAGRPTDKGL